MLPDNSVLIACSMMEYELGLILKEVTPELPVVWMERGLHDLPQKLQTTLQAEIDKHQQRDYILLAYGLCGNGTLALRSEHARLVVPKFDDCIRMLLTLKQGQAPDTCPSCFYFTNGWIDHEAFSLNKIDSYLERYGETNGRRIIQAIYGNYTGINFIDLPSYRWQDYVQEVADTAERLNLEIGSCPGSLRVLEKLLRGQWDEEFCLLEPQEELTYKHFEGRAV